MRLYPSQTVVPSLADLTTLRVGGPAASYVEAVHEEDLVAAVQEADDEGVPLLVVGGGSNLLVADEGFDGVVVRDARSGIRVESADSCGGAVVSAPAGQSWDELAQRAVEEGWVGVESLSGIPGTVGAVPVQNVGAYGQEVAGVIAAVRTWDRAERRKRTFAVGELDFGYRTSLLKRSMHVSSRPVDPQAPWYPSPRYVVLEVQFQFRLGSMSAPVGYFELARRLGVEVGQKAPSSDVREAVLALRAGKGMLLDTPAPGGDPDHDRWNSGSFFTNPVVPVEHMDRLPADAPRYPVRNALPTTSTGPALGAVDSGVVKTSAAWLIEHAGFGKGFGLAGERSPARLSTKHTLAMTNRGGARADDVVALARAVRDGVRDRFGVTLVPETVLVGVTL
ncbi:UDP-N-acetylmuramate dehydrogenase [Antribacter gilvus]|uniref:UDP-N-acetylmuramate dehydrogenase n=1 Tax=Antribacter gilvus TaxID=2304675 RepID=UPI000F7879DE|nr:UDP-N-acetylmuramate dehydrogenase [Antribacter gilvus]